MIVRKPDGSIEIVRAIIRSLDIEELSGVDKPAQQPALAVLCKRVIQPPSDTPNTAQLNPTDSRPDTADVTGEAQPMDTISKADHEAAIKKLQSELAAVTSKLTATEEAGEKMASELKALADAEEARKASAVVYTCLDGTEIPASADPLVVKFAQRADDQERARLHGELRKRAEDSLGHLPGTVDVLASILGAVESIPDEETRKAAVSVLKAADATHADAFTRRGHTGAASPDSPEGRYEKRLAEYAKENKVTKEQAAVRLMRDPEFQKLAAQVN